MTDTLNNGQNALEAAGATRNNRHVQSPEVASVELEFSTPPSLDGVEWHIIAGKNGDRLRVIEDPDVEMLFAGENAGLLFSVYPTAERLRKPDEVELTVRTAYIKGNTGMSDWNTLPQIIRESGLNITVRILIPSDLTDDFFDAISSGMARRGECRWAEFLLDDTVIANYLSCGEQFEFERWGLFQKK